MARRIGGSARRSTPGFLLQKTVFASAAPNRCGAPPGGETIQSEIDDRIEVL
jgi:hypothetical protein